MGGKNQKQPRVAKKTYASKHRWTKIKDVVLVDCLVELTKDVSWKGENGFRIGCLQHLEKLMAKKLSLMMPFFNRTGLERIGVVRLEITLLLGWSVGSGYCTAGLQFLNVALICKDKKERGPAGASPVAAPMPKSISF